VKLFQIEEPDGGTGASDMPGAAIAIDAGGAAVEVAFSVGGNAVVLEDREGFERVVAVPDAAAAKMRWQELFETARTRAERALARPVSHAVLVLAAAADVDTTILRGAADAAGLKLLRIVRRAELPGGASAALSAAILAEDLAPRPA
jgi:hypothetical protein